MLVQTTTTGVKNICAVDCSLSPFESPFHGSYFCVRVFKKVHFVRQALLLGTTGKKKDEKLVG